MFDVVTPILTHKLFISFIFIAIPLSFSALLIKQIKKRNEILTEQQRRWIWRIKNGAVSLALFGLLITWWPELRQFALSIAAVAVAIVIASKELILCVSGTVLRTATGAFSVGDWIEVGEMRGEVIDHNMLSTKLQELNNSDNSYHYSGKTVVIPNSMFLVYPVKNLNFMNRFVFHRFSITTEPEVNIFEAKALILSRLEQHVSGFIDVARRYNSVIEKRAGIDIPSADPRILIRTTDQGKNVFNVTLFCPTSQAVNIEQKVVEDFMTFFYEQKKKLAAS